MTQVTYKIFSGTQPVEVYGNVQLTDLEEAKRLAREVSASPTQQGSTITVISRKPEPLGEEWRGLAAVFIDGEEVGPNDQRWPHELVP
jgi:hypothetical protein